MKFNKNANFIPRGFKIRMSTDLCGLKEGTDIDITEAIAEIKSVK